MQWKNAKKKKKREKKDEREEGRFLAKKVNKHQEEEEIHHQKAAADVSKDDERTNDDCCESWYFSHPFSSCYRKKETEPGNPRDFIWFMTVKWKKGSRGKRESEPKKALEKLSQVDLHTCWKKLELQRKKKKMGLPPSLVSICHSHTGVLCTTHLSHSRPSVNNNGIRKMGKAETASPSFSSFVLLLLSCCERGEGEETHSMCSRSHLHILALKKDFENILCAISSLRLSEMMKLAHDRNDGFQIRSPCQRGRRKCHYFPGFSDATFYEREGDGGGGGKRYVGRNESNVEGLHYSQVWLTLIRCNKQGRSDDAPKRGERERGGRPKAVFECVWRDEEEGADDAFCVRGLVTIGMSDCISWWKAALVVTNIIVSHSTNLREEEEGSQLFA